MAKSHSLPRFTLGYFPLNDDEGHQEGLEQAASTCLERFDDFLGQFIEHLGGWDVIGNEYAFLFVGDHAQVQWDGDDDRPIQVDLDELLDDFAQADTASGFQHDDQILICPNMRAAAIYLATPNPVIRNRIVDRLVRAEGIDQVMYQEDRPDQICMLTVRTCDRGHVSFTRAQDGSAELKAIAADRYGNQWSIHGETTALDVTLRPDGTIVEGVYPNPFERIEGAFSSSASPIWVTARRDAEFAIRGASVHEGGSHGSLHVEDSQAALLTTSDVDLGMLTNPDHPRIIDVLDLVLGTLGAARTQSNDSQATAHLA